MVNKVIVTALHISIYSLALLLITQSSEGIEIGYTGGFDQQSYGGIIFLISGAVLWFGTTIINPVANLLASPLVFLSFGLLKIFVQSIINLSILGAIVFLTTFISVNDPIRDFLTLYFLVSMVSIISSLLIRFLKD